MVQKTVFEPISLDLGYFCHCLGVHSDRLVSQEGKVWGTVEVLLRCDEVVLFSTTEKVLPRTSLVFLAWRAFLFFFLEKLSS